MIVKARLILPLMTMATGVAAIAAPPSLPASAAAMDTLLACLDVVDPGARLTCFEAQARALKGATARKEVIIIDQAEVQKTRRSLFGFTLPHIALFDGPASLSKGKDGKPQEPDLERLQTTVREAYRGSSGLWILVLEDGARWQQIESGREADEPRAGVKIDIRKATMGSYFARIGSSTYMRIRRIS